MAQLRAKQIKLQAAGDLLVGGVTGNGVVLPIGTANQVLKVIDGGLTYATQTAADVAFTPVADKIDATTVSAAILEVFDDAVALVQAEATRASGKEADLQAEIDAIEASVGLNADGSQAFWNGTTYIIRGSAEDATDPENVIPAVAADTYKVAIEKLDAALKANADADAALALEVDGIDTRLTTAEADIDALELSVADNAAAIAALGNAFNYVGTVEGGADDQNPFILDTLETDEKDAGDYHKVSAAGWFKYGTADAFYANINDGLVFNTEAGVDVIDNTNSAVFGTANRIAVNGTMDTGFTVDIAAGYVGQTSIITLGTVTTGTWNGSVVGQAYGGTGIATVTTGADQHKVLRVNDQGVLEYGHVVALRDEAGVLVANAAGGKLVAAVATDSADAALSFTTKGYVDALIDGAISGAAKENLVDEFTLTEATVEFDLTETPVGAFSVYVNGLKLSRAAYSISGQIVTVNEGIVGYALEAGDVVAIDYTAAITA